MDAASWLAAPVLDVPGVSGRLASTLAASFDIRTVRDLLEYWPRRYHDIGDLRLVADAVPGEPVTVLGRVERWSRRELGAARRRPGRSPRPRILVTARLVDESGYRVDLPFFNQEWPMRRHPQGSLIAASGTLEQFRGTWQLKNPKITEVDDPELLQAQRIQPRYPATRQLSSARIGGLIRAALDRLEHVDDHLPEVVRAQRGLMDLDTAWRTVHRPASADDLHDARRRLVYDELFTLQLGLQRRRHRTVVSGQGLVQPPVGDGLADRFLLSLPFDPTPAQRRAMTELAHDLGADIPMHRLLQGDVGAGKTLVALWAMLTAVDHGRQAVLMAPTEVLAEQHHATLAHLLAPLGVDGPGGPRLALVTGSTSTSRLRGLLAELAVGDVDLVVGTHALLEDRVAIPQVGLVVVDEQHRFGVEHRSRLRDKRDDDHAPDVLVMTATPIPRSLALTVYGDLDVTVLDELPPGRQPIRTTLLQRDSERRAALYDFVRERVRAGQRCFVVCPTIDDSEALDVASATSTFARLSEVFGGLGVGLLHGRMPSAEKEQVMADLRSGAVGVLVTTTVIEVGVDVPEASIMIVEDADRFGISQLHQLRGRVGRGSESAWCVLFHSGDAPSERLLALEQHRSGFDLAEVDLELRGEGSLFDTRQSGLPDLRIASLARDLDVVQMTKQDAAAVVGDDPELSDHPGLADEVRRRYGDERLAALDAA